MPEKALLKKALSWFRVIVFASDIISDIFVIVDLFNHCLYHIAGFALLTFLSTGAFSGGFMILQMGQEFIKEKYGHTTGYCGKNILFLLGTIFGPFIFIPAGIYLLIKAALYPGNDEVNKNAKK